MWYLWWQWLSDTVWYICTRSYMMHKLSTKEAENDQMTLTIKFAVTFLSFFIFIKFLKVIGHIWPLLSKILAMPNMKIYTQIALPIEVAITIDVTWPSQCWCCTYTGPELSYIHTWMGASTRSGTLQNQQPISISMASGKIDVTPVH